MIEIKSLRNSFLEGKITNIVFFLTENNPAAGGFCSVRKNIADALTNMNSQNLWQLSSRKLSITFNLNNGPYFIETSANRKSGSVHSYPYNRFFFVYNSRVYKSILPSYTAFFYCQQNMFNLFHVSISCIHFSPLLTEFSSHTNLTLLIILVFLTNNHIPPY